MLTYTGDMTIYTQNYLQPNNTCWQKHNKHTGGSSYSRYIKRKPSGKRKTPPHHVIIRIPKLNINPITQCLIHISNKKNHFNK